MRYDIVIWQIAIQEEWWNDAKDLYEKGNKNRINFSFKYSLEIYSINPKQKKQ